MRRPARATPTPAAPVAAGLVLALVVGLFGLCHAAFSGSAGDHLGPSSTALAAQPVGSGGAVDLGSSLHDSSERGAAGDCALLVACTVTLLGLGGLLVLRASRTDRVLWLRAAPVRRTDGIPSRRAHRSAFVREPAALVC